MHAQVLRYAALFTGVGYGFYHQASLTAKTKAAHVDREFENQASLIAKAKAEWVKKTMPKDVKEGAGEFCCLLARMVVWKPTVVGNFSVGGENVVCLECWACMRIGNTRIGFNISREGRSNRWANFVIFAVISDPNDPKFDLEAYLTLSEAK